MTDNQSHQEFIQALKQAIMEHANQFYMPDWMTGRNEVSELGVCGTTLCIGGFSCVLAGDTLKRDEDLGYIISISRDDVLSIVDRAEMLIQPWSAALFNFNLWPDDLEKAFRIAETNIDRAAVACQAIDYYCLCPNFA